MIVEFADGVDLPEQWEGYELHDNGWVTVTGYGDSYDVPRERIKHIWVEGQESVIA